MELKYDFQIDDLTVVNYLRKLIDQTYKLLPTREEKADWQKLLGTILLELAGISRLLTEYQASVLAIACKLEGLYTLTEDRDFYMYRKTIFECIALLSEVIAQCQD